MEIEKVSSVDEQEEEQQAQEKGKGKCFRTLVLMAVLLVTLCIPALAADGEISGGSGLSVVIAQVPTAVTLVGNVFDLISGNAYLALLMAFGLVAVSIRLFCKSKRAAR